MKYRARKEEAERKLQATAKNILRLEDILRELESRLEPLRLQSEKAAEYFRLREELRELEINLFLYQYDKSNERLQQLRGVAVSFPMKFRCIGGRRGLRRRLCQRGRA